MKGALRSYELLNSNSLINLGVSEYKLHVNRIENPD